MQTINRNANVSNDNFCGLNPLLFNSNNKMYYYYDLFYVNGKKIVY